MLKARFTTTRTGAHNAPGSRGQGSDSPVWAGGGGGAGLPQEEGPARVWKALREISEEGGAHPGASQRCLGVGVRLIHQSQQ